MAEEQATEATAMSTTPPLESSSAAAAVDDEDNDDDFGTFSAYETAESSDMMKSDNDDGSSPDEDLQEKNAPAALVPPPPPSAMMSSSLHEEEFFDASSETAADMNQMNDLANENAEEEAVAITNQPEMDLFGSDAAMTPDAFAAAVEESEGEINENIIAYTCDEQFCAFDGIADNNNNNSEGGGEQTETFHVNEQDSNIVTDGFGEFEGTKSDSSNNNAETSPSNGDGNDDDAVVDSPVDTFQPVAIELAKDESTRPESGENPPPETHSTEEMHNTTAPADAFAAFDAFAEIQDAAPLPSFGSATSGAVEEVEGDAFTFGQSSEPADVVIETATMEASDDNFGEFAEVTSLEHAADGKTNIEDNVAFTSSLDDNAANEDVDREDAEEIETAPEEEEVSQVPEISIDEAPTPVATSAEDDNAALEAVKNDGGDVFGAFEETVPIQPLQESTAEIKNAENESAEISDNVIEIASTSLQGTTESTIPCEEGKEEKPTNKDSPDAQDDSFGFSSFEAAVPVEGTTANEIEKDEVIFEGDATPVESAVEETDAFGAFSAPTEEDTDTAYADQDIPAEDDTALATEKDAALDDAAMKENDHFDDFSARTEEVLPTEVDTALTEEEKAPMETAVEENNDFGDFTTGAEMDAARGEMDTAIAEGAIEESDFGDFGGFAAVSVVEDEALVDGDLPVEEDVGLAEQGAPSGIEMDAALTEGAIEESDFGDFGGFAAVSVVEDEALPEGDLPIEEDVGLAEQDTPFPEGGIEDNDDFGDFSAPVGEAPLAEVDTALTEEDDDLAEKPVHENDDFGNFSAPVEVEIAAPDEVESNNFGDFTAPSVESTSPADEAAAVNESAEFGDFDGFSSPAVEDGATIEAATEGADEDFGDFGDFSAPVEAETENNLTEEGPDDSHEPVDVQPAVEDDDDFGEFGDFAAFEEAAPADDIPADNQQTAQDEEKATVDDIPTPQVQSSQAVSPEEDEFGDFGAFEESDTVEKTSGKSAPSRPVLVLNDNVRDMFQKVFQVDNPVESEKGDGCIELPFDVPMRTVLAPRNSDTKENDNENQTYKSEQEIKDITHYIESLPTSPPSTILSEEKWYPYSQYIFHHDGTPYTEKSNLMMSSMAAPAVPEVLSIQLPTGFDASTFSPKTSSSSSLQNGRFTEPPTKQPVRPTATMVDFPSADVKMTEEDVKEAAEDDEFGKLSAAGKKFMEQLPDLSYMLHPTLSTVK